jgi:pyruvate/2-oxoacid:ferredoxin oxidoreductase alpha subunit/pyruvate/2-oxoacid:ferredoxin oxidoreductase beta subunit
MIRVITGNEAAAYGALLSRPDVICAYPITPQSRIPEQLSEFHAQGLLKGALINVESEMAAIGYVIGASLGGVRVFTATSSQGLAWMHEGLHWAAGTRLPIVLVNVNRPLGSPWNLTCDQIDSLSQRDTGWMQFYCESNQEVLDSVILAYKVSEEVNLPAMVCLDGVYLSYVAESVEIPSQDMVDVFLPPYDAAFEIPSRYKLYANRPLEEGSYLDRTGYLDTNYMEDRYELHKLESRCLPAVLAADEVFQAIFGHNYPPVEEYKCEDADLAVVMAGSAVGTGRHVIDVLRDRGEKVGLLKVRMFHPFPLDLVRETLAGRKKVVVIERDISPGQCGIFYQEIKWALNMSGEGGPPPMYGFVCGLGGEDITPTPPARKPSGWACVRGRKEMATTGAPSEFAEEECLRPPKGGHSACPGCGMVMALRYVLNALNRKVILVIPPGCAGPTVRLPEPSLRYRGEIIRQISVPFGSSTTVSAGLKKALAVRGEKETEIITWAGDGAIFDIGLASLSGSAERNDDILCMCYDNEGYQNTGKQRSSATPWMAATSTSPVPAPKQEFKKDIMSILAAHRVPYAATATIAYPQDLMRKVAKARVIRGFRFFHILTPCPTGWGYPSWFTVRMSRLAVRTRIFPLFEVEGGMRYTVNRKAKALPVEAYLKLQGRFKHLVPEDLAEIQKRVAERWDQLVWMEGFRPKLTDSSS